MSDISLPHSCPYCDKPVAVRQDGQFTTLDCEAPMGGPALQEWKRVHGVSDATVEAACARLFREAKP